MSTRPRPRPGRCWRAARRIARRAPTSADLAWLTPGSSMATRGTPSPGAPATRGARGGGRRPGRRASRHARQHVDTSSSPSAERRRGAGRAGIGGEGPRWSGPRDPARNRHEPRADTTPATRQSQRQRARGGPSRAGAGANESSSNSSNRQRRPNLTLVKSTVCPSMPSDRPTPRLCRQRGRRAGWRPSAVDARAPPPRARARSELSCRTGPRAGARRARCDQTRRPLRPPTRAHVASEAAASILSADEISAPEQLAVGPRVAVLELGALAEPDHEGEAARG